MSDVIPATEDPGQDVPAVDPTPPVAFEYATIGTVLTDVETQPLAEGWRVLDGSQLISAEWPEFVRAMGIAGATFTLPAPERTRPGYRYLIKLGRHAPLPVLPAPVTNTSEVQARHDALFGRRA